MAALAAIAAVAVTGLLPARRLATAVVIASAVAAVAYFVVIRLMSGVR